MSQRTVFVCDLCKETIEDGEPMQKGVHVLLGDGVEFSGDACGECAYRLRDAVRRAARYYHRGTAWPSFASPTEAEDKGAPTP